MLIDSVQPNQGIPILIRSMTLIEPRLHANIELMKLFLTCSLFVYETPALQFSEAAAKLYPTFFWGLSSSDSNLRNRFVLKRKQIVYF